MAWITRNPRPSFQTCEWVQLEPLWWSFDHLRIQLADQETTIQAIHYHPLGGSFTIANKSRKDRVVGPLPNGRTPWLKYMGGHILTTYPSVLRWSSKHHPKDRGAKAVVKKSSTVKPGQDLGPLLKVELLVGYIRSCQVKGWLVNLWLPCVLRPHFSGPQLVSFPPKPRVYGFFLGILKDLPRNHRQQDMQFGLSRRARCRRPTKWEYGEGWASGRWITQWVLGENFKLQSQDVSARKITPGFQSIYLLIYNLDLTPHTVTVTTRIITFF